MEVFDAYAKYYDILYKDKDYEAEADYVLGFIKKNSPDAITILDLGCGTGRHDVEFIRKGYKVTGVELSERMIEAAKKRINVNENPGLSFVNCDIRKLKLGKKFDVVTSLFHVMSYQTSTEDVRSSFNCVKEHLGSNGLFIFDFWYGPAVLNEKPEIRMKKLEGEDYDVERTATPVMRKDENVVEVNFEVNIVGKTGSNNNKILETHRMRYFFLPEIENFLKEAGMELMHTEEWMTGKAVSDESWSVIAIAGNRD